MVETTIGTVLTEEIIEKYFTTLVNKIFKILPIIENQEDSVLVYMESLWCELDGLQSLIPSVGEDPIFLSLLSILKWLFDNVENSDMQYKTIRREVFHAISVCKKLRFRVDEAKEEEVV